MTDLDQILALVEELDASGTEYVLATVVAVDGSGYRKPGARMLVASDGRRVGTISGGCLEGEVARKAFWHTERGPVVRRYSTNPDDGDVPFGMGCGGTVHLLLERSATARPALRQLARSFSRRIPLGIATVLEGPEAGRRAYLSSGEGLGDSALGDNAELTELARQALHGRLSFSRKTVQRRGITTTVWAEYCPARPGLLIFGAGDDAIPLVRIARQLGWYVAVYDGRSHLATEARFPEAHAVAPLPALVLPEMEIRSTDAAVVMTHSLEQDVAIVTKLLLEPLEYLGVLGPQKRTRELLGAIAKDHGLISVGAEAQVEQWLNGLHAPMGLDMGSETPAEIALAVMAEIQQNRRRTTGRPLREVRGTRLAYPETDKQPA